MYVKYSVVFILLSICTLKSEVFAQNSPPNTILEKIKFNDRIKTQNYNVKPNMTDNPPYNNVASNIYRSNSLNENLTLLKILNKKKKNNTELGDKGFLKQKNENFVNKFQGRKRSESIGRQVNVIGSAPSSIMIQTANNSTNNFQNIIMNTYRNEMNKNYDDKKIHNSMTIHKSKFKSNKEINNDWQENDLEKQETNINLTNKIPTDNEKEINHLKQNKSKLITNSDINKPENHNRKQITSENQTDFVIVEQEDFSDTLKNETKSQKSDPERYVEDDSTTYGILLNFFLKYFLDKKLKPFYLPKDTGNEKCDFVLEKFNLKKQWSIQMLDSWGKSNDGLLFGNLHLVGMFEECLKIKGSESVQHTNFTSIQFNGRYCTIYYNFGNTTTERNLHSNNSVSYFKIKSNPEAIDISKLKQNIPFYYASCIPSVCTNDDFQEHLKSLFEKTNKRFLSLDCTTEDEKKENLDDWDISVLTCLAVVLFLVIQGTFADVYLNYMQSGFKFRYGMFEFVLCFSWLKTMKKVFNTNASIKAKDITCIHGLKVISLLWIIICHQYKTSLDFLSNTADGPSYQDELYNQFITNGWISVNTFFLITGTLISYRLIPLLQITNCWGKRIYILFISIFRRIMRLAPSIVAVSAFSATLIRFFGMGPRQHLLSKWSMEDCRENWWKDSLFINNFIYGEQKGYEIPDCLSHCWYTSVDIQLYLIMPFIILPLLFVWKFGLLWLGFITVVSTVIPAVIIDQNNLTSSPLIPAGLQEYYDYTTKVFITPWCRSGPWIIGIWLGIILSRKGIKDIKISPIFVQIGYILALTLTSLLTFGLFDYNVLFDAEKEPKWIAVTYGGFGWTVWAIAVGWVVFTCHTGNAKIVNDLLSWPGWQPLSRLSLSIYLVSPVVQLWWSSVLYRPVYFNYLQKLLESCGIIFISGVIGVLLCTSIEIPINMIIDIFLPSSGPKRPMTMVDERKKRNILKNVIEQIPNYNPSIPLEKLKF